MKILWGALAGAIIMMPACDVVRYPGDGRETQEPVDIPEGAPGPPPPAEPVDDPYDDGDAPDTDPADVTDPGTPALPDPGTDTDIDSDPDTVTDTGAQDPVTPDPEMPDPETADPETPDTDVSDPDVSGPEVTDPDVTGPDVTEPVLPDTDTDTDTEPETPDPGTPDPVDVVDTDPAPVDPDPVEPEPEPVVVFSYIEPGQLQSGSGTGTNERDVIFSPDMRFPIKSAPSYLQSQVWGFGGGVGGGDQCDPRNYEYPWRDNFCETRSSNRNSPYCPVSRIHQGQDIRVGTAAGCNELRRTAAAERGMYEVVATEDGIIQSIGTYTVTQRSGPRIYKYMHMNMRNLRVSQGDTVTKGQTLGFVSNDFGGTPTTFHLHFELLQNTAEDGWVHVPPYTSLVSAYERREDGIGRKIEANIGVASAAPALPEGEELPDITEGFISEEEAALQ